MQLNILHYPGQAPKLKDHSAPNIHQRRKWQPAPAFLPRKSQRQRDLRAAVPGVVRAGPDLAMKPNTHSVKAEKPCFLDLWTGEFSDLGSLE